MCSELGEYLEQMRLRHRPTPSMRKMSLEAGLGSSHARMIIKEGRGASPQTLKALSDRWGEPGDYERLLKLAGHPMPGEPIDRLSDEGLRELAMNPRFLETASFEQLLEVVMALSRADRRLVLAESIRRLLQGDLEPRD